VWCGSLFTRLVHETDERVPVDALAHGIRTIRRLLTKAHAIDVLACPRRRSRMSVIAVITDPA
jgi:hypothetical protein